MCGETIRSRAGTAPAGKSAWERLRSIYVTLTQQAADPLADLTARLRLAPQRGGQRPLLGELPIGLVVQVRGG